MKRTSGVYTKLGNTSYFVPHALPPQNPDFTMTKAMAKLHNAALKSLKKLHDISTKLPDAQRFIHTYVLKEALLSSEIEGIHTTLLEALTQSLEPNQKKIPKNTRLVLNYTRALTTAIELLSKKNLPISTRVLLETHNVLMGSEVQADPGKYRSQSVRVGQLVPPPADKIPTLMHDLEKYINEEDSNIPPLIRAGLVHVQFETIHPFLDGNGRIGRLLIVLMLFDSKLLTMPILYPSLYFKSNRFEYYHWLDSVRTTGNFEGWIAFYLKAIKAASKDAYQRIEKIEKAINKLRKTVKTHKELLTLNISSDELIDQLILYPITSIDILAEGLHKTIETTKQIIAYCEQYSILVPAPRGLWHFKMYLDLIDQ